jgi:hypothetical protein
MCASRQCQRSGIAHRPTVKSVPLVWLSLAVSLALPLAGCGGQTEGARGAAPGAAGGSLTGGGSFTGGEGGQTSAAGASGGSGVGGKLAGTGGLPSTGGVSSGGARATGGTGTGGASFTCGAAGWGGCDFGVSCCNGVWVNPNNDINNCGRCGQRCSGPSPYCGNGTCGTPPCGVTTCGVAGEVCCGTSCCASGQLCCTIQLEPTVLQCAEPVNGTCPPVCF